LLWPWSKSKAEHGKEGEVECRYAKYVEGVKTCEDVSHNSVRAKWEVQVDLKRRRGRHVA